MTTDEIASFVKSLRDAGLSESETAAALKAKMEDDRAQKAALARAHEAEAEMRGRVAVAALQTVVGLYEIEERRLRRYNSFSAKLGRFFSF